MNSPLKAALAAVTLAVAAQASTQVAFYEHERFDGRTFTTQRQVGNFERYGFNDRASSAALANGRWEVCEEMRFDGRCVVPSPGRYPSLASMGLNDSVSSLRSFTRNARGAADYYQVPTNRVIELGTQVEI